MRRTIFDASTLGVILTLIGAPAMAQQGGAIPPLPAASADPCKAAPSPRRALDPEKLNKAAETVVNSPQTVDRTQAARAAEQDWVRSFTPTSPHPAVDGFYPVEEVPDKVPSKLGNALNIAGKAAGAVDAGFAANKMVEGYKSGDSGAMLEGAASLEPTIDVGCDVAKTGNALMRGDIPGVIEGASALGAKGAGCVIGFVEGGVLGCRWGVGTVDGIIETGQWAVDKAIDAHFERETELILERADSDIARRREELRAREQARRSEFERGNQYVPPEPSASSDTSGLDAFQGLIQGITGVLQQRQQNQSTTSAPPPAAAPAPPPMTSTVMQPSTQQRSTQRTEPVTTFGPARQPTKAEQCAPLYNDNVDCNWHYCMGLKCTPRRK